MITFRIAGVPEHFNLPWELALERRAFLRAGIDVQWRTVPEGTGAMCGLLRSGEVDLAILVTEGAVRDILRGNPSRIISNYVDSPLTWGVHVGASTNLHSPDDLKHVPFAISRFNSGSHLMAMTYAKQQGWEPTEKDFIIVNDLAGAVQRMQGPDPMVFLWEKFITASYVHSGQLRRVDEYQPTWPCFMVVARNEVLQENGTAVRTLLKIVRDQAQGLMQKKNAPQIIASRYAMKLADAREWFGTVRWNTDGRVDGLALQAVQRSLQDVGMLDANDVAARHIGNLIQSL